MSKILQVVAILMLAVACGFLYKVTFYPHNAFRIIPFFYSSDEPTINATSKTLTPKEILQNGNGIIFIETTNRMEPPALVLCAVESAARVYPDRPVTFFMKGLPDINSKEDEIRAKQRFPILSFYDNVYIFPLRMEEIYNNTPLLPWYKKVNPDKEIHWIHVSSDGIRLALLWKFGGIYMDTDIISIRPIPLKNFLAAESALVSSNGVFGLCPSHAFAWKSMEDFVQNYNGAIWGHQGPALFTRILNKFFCTIPGFQSTEDVMCGNILFTNPVRFYPIPGPTWRRFYEVWDHLPAFNDSYALHLFNYANTEHFTMVPGSNSLVDRLYKQYCPFTYGLVLKKQSFPSKNSR
ncbi:hypothetical protein GDO86_010353 [Hymenochirus boettgeri]|uniref:Alpha 1,4-glycosyltransferase domain-containing protein n=1 Tax=Hymenochirus boettgeri TaxID=247094 RepID=A0A8T2JP49_9PIPI|nr:hypothetical protein GDO86_010353 [Hymenochirus boettgeri]